MELWGFENSKMASERRDSLLQETGAGSIAPSNTPGGGGGGGQTNNTVDLHPSHQTLLDQAPATADLTHGPQEAVVVFQQAPATGRGQLIADPLRNWRAPTMWSYKVAYTENGTPGLQEGEMAQIARNTQDLPEYGELIRRDSAPVVATYDPTTRRLVNTREGDSNYHRFQLAQQNVEENGSGSHTLDPALDLLDHNRETSPAMEEKMRRIERELARLIAALQAGEDIETLLPQIGIVLEMQGGAVAARQAVTTIRRLNALRHDQLESNKRLARLHGRHSTDTAAQARNNESVTNENARLQVLRDGIEETQNLLRTTLSGIEGAKDLTRALLDHSMRMARS